MSEVKSPVPCMRGHAGRWRRPTPRAEIANERLPRILRQYQQGGAGRWAAIGKSTGEFLGWFALDPGEGEGEVELGYRLRHAAWGKGFATEGSRALVRMAPRRPSPNIPLPKKGRHLPPEPVRARASTANAKTPRATVDHELFRPM